MMNNIKTKLLQLEWINSELEWIFYELNKFWNSFYIENSFSKFIFLFSLSSGLRTQ
jgi:hypothetical protein